MEKMRGDRGRASAYSAPLFLLMIGLHANADPETSWLTVPITFIVIAIVGYAVWSIVEEAICDMRHRRSGDPSGDWRQP